MQSGRSRKHKDDDEEELLPTAPVGLFITSAGKNKTGQCGVPQSQAIITQTGNAAAGLSPPDKTMMIAKITCGQDFVVVLTQGKVFVAGSNGHAQHGTGERNNQGRYQINTPVPLTAPAVDVCCGAGHVVARLGLDALLKDGGVVTWGHNDYGQCGRESQGAEECGHPGRVELKTEPQRIFAGASCTFFYCDKDMYACGRNDCGQLCLGKPSEQGESHPRRVEALSGEPVVIEIQAGKEHGLALRENCSVLVWGRLLGNLVDGSADWTPEEGCKGIVLSIPGAAPMRSIAAGSEHAAVVDWDGNLWRWGAGKKYRLGFGDQENVPQPKAAPLRGGVRAAVVCCGDRTTFVRALDNRVHGCGDGQQGMLSSGKDVKQFEVLDLARGCVPVVGSTGAHALFLEGGAHKLAERVNHTSLHPVSSDVFRQETSDRKDAQLEEAAAWAEVLEQATEAAMAIPLKLVAESAEQQRMFEQARQEREQLDQQLGALQGELARARQGAAEAEAAGKDAIVRQQGDTESQHRKEVARIRRGLRDEIDRIQAVRIQERQTHQEQLERERAAAAAEARLAAARSDQVCERLSYRCEEQEARAEIARLFSPAMLELSAAARFDAHKERQARARAVGELEVKMQETQREARKQYLSLGDRASARCAGMLFSMHRRRRWLRWREWVALSLLKRAAEHLNWANAQTEAARQEIRSAQDQNKDLHDQLHSTTTRLQDTDDQLKRKAEEWFSLDNKLRSEIQVREGVEGRLGHAESCQAAAEARQKLAEAKLELLAEEMHKRVDVSLKLLADHRLTIDSAAEELARQRAKEDPYSPEAQAALDQEAKYSAPEPAVATAALVIDALAKQVMEGKQDTEAYTSARQWAKKLWKREARLALAQQSAENQEDMATRTSGIVAVQPGTRDKLLAFARYLADCWHNKRGDFMDELCENLTVPAEEGEAEGEPKDKRERAIAQLAAKAALDRSEELTGATALLQVLYSMEGVDTDKLMGFSGTGSFKEYRMRFQDQYLRNPTLHDDFPLGIFPLGRGEKKQGPAGRLGGAPKALFRVWNWALRTVYDGPFPKDDEMYELQVSAEKMLQRWIKTLTAMMAAVSPLQNEALVGSLQKRVQILAEVAAEAHSAKGGGAAPAAGKGRHGDRVPVLESKQLRTLRDAVDACSSGRGEVYRGLSWLTEEQYEQQRKLKLRDGLPVAQLTSTTVIEVVAMQFLGGQYQSLHVIEQPPTGMPLWDTSKYPQEAEVLLPACVMLEVKSEPVVRRRQETVDKVPVELVRKLVLTKEDAHLTIVDYRTSDSGEWAKETAPGYKLWLNRQITEVNGVSVRTSEELDAELSKATPPKDKPGDPPHCKLTILTPYLEVRLRPAESPDMREHEPKWDLALDRAQRQLEEVERLLIVRSAKDDETSKLAEQARALTHPAAQMDPERRREVAQMVHHTVAHSTAFQPAEKRTPIDRRSSGGRCPSCGQYPPLTNQFPGKTLRTVPAAKPKTPPQLPPLVTPHPWHWTDHSTGIACRGSLAVKVSPLDDVAACMAAVSLTCAAEPQSWRVHVTGDLRGVAVGVAHPGAPLSGVQLHRSPHAWLVADGFRGRREAVAELQLTWDADTGTADLSVAVNGIPRVLRGLSPPLRPVVVLHALGARAKLQCPGLPSPGEVSLPALPQRGTMSP
eukprot:TRINITY_DN2021_c1_g1_i1.p1 TRINITY_DN2021_c1_g1~~TRINITY_DN2021_c1_g1_i1.p1  ORF type:complete len:1694 (+),score=547.94 TRINITY_DN2021_c1_g1_i1:89-5083(+)